MTQLRESPSGYTLCIAEERCDYNGKEIVVVQLASRLLTIEEYEQRELYKLQLDHAKGIQLTIVSFKIAAMYNFFSIIIWAIQNDLIDSIWSNEIIETATKNGANVEKLRSLLCV